MWAGIIAGPVRWLKLLDIEVIYSVPETSKGDLNVGVLNSELLHIAVMDEAKCHMRPRVRKRIEEWNIMREHVQLHI